MRKKKRGKESQQCMRQAEKRRAHARKWRWKRRRKRKRKKKERVSEGGGNEKERDGERESRGQLTDRQTELTDLQRDRQDWWSQFMKLT